MIIRLLYKIIGVFCLLSITLISVFAQNTTKNIQYGEKNENTKNIVSSKAENTNLLMQEIVGDSMRTMFSTAYEVGSLGGEADVSAVGSAVYQIPIQLPVGIGNMVPQLGIVYNSMGGNGILGQGFSLSGLSTISRTGQTVFHDGKVTGISYDFSDRFTLDGNRLFATSQDTTLASIIYIGEDHNYDIIERKFPNNLFFESFKVKSKTGRTLEYAAPIFSTEGGYFNKNLGFYVSKIFDNDSNYVAYNYANIAGETVLQNIQYTGNMAKNISPAISIEFTYITRQDSNALYVNKYKYVQKNLLSKISIKTNGILVGEYQFVYNYTNIAARLVEIKYLVNGIQEINSTTFFWGYSGILSQLLYTGLTDEMNWVYFGDFNHDGKTDFIRRNSAYWKYFQANNNGAGFTYINESPIANDASIFLADGDNDGDIDLYVNYANKVAYDCNCVPCNGGFLLADSISSVEVNSKKSGDVGIDVVPPDELCCDICYYYESGFKAFSFNGSTLAINNALNINYPTVQVFLKLLPGDYNGDGKTDFIELKPDNSYYNSRGFTLISTSNFPVFSDYNLLDIDGDGKTEIVFNNATKYLKYDNNTKTFVQFNLLGSNAANVEFGDFNGDGVIDYIYTSNYDTYIQYGGSNTPKKVIDRTTFSDIIQLRIADFNGDGKSDILSRTLVFDGYDFKNTGNDLFISSGMQFEQIPLSIMHGNIIDGYDVGIRYLADFNGDGKADEIFVDENNTVKVFRFFENDNSLLLSSVTDGFENTTAFAYRNLNDSTGFYVKGTTSVFPLNDLIAPIRVVSSISKPNGLGGQSITQFTYEGARIHRQGKGFLGFSKITSSNSISNRKIVNTTELENTFYSVSKTTSIISIYNGVTALSTNENNFAAITPNAFYPSSRFKYLASSIQTDLLNANSTKITNTYNTDGNLTQTKTDFGNNGSSEKTVTYSNFVAAGFSKPNLPRLITDTTKHADHSTSQVNKTYYTYKTHNGAVLSKVNNYAITGKTITTKYGYNDVGLVVSEIVIPSGLPGDTVKYT